MESCRIRTARALRTRCGTLGSTGLNYSVKPSADRQADRAGSNLDATGSLRIRSHMLLSFQRPSAPSGGDSALEATREYSAAATEVARWARSADAQPYETPLADLEDGAVETLGRNVELLGRERLAVYLDAALGQ